MKCPLAETLKGRSGEKPISLVTVLKEREPEREGIYEFPGRCCAMRFSAYSMQAMVIRCVPFSDA
jgi:hypothetical protein